MRNSGHALRLAVTLGCALLIGAGAAPAWAGGAAQDPPASATDHAAPRPTDMTPRIFAPLRIDRGLYGSTFRVHPPGAVDRMAMPAAALASPAPPTSAGGGN